MEAAVITSPPFRPGRTDPCFCGSGLRFKVCCGSVSENRSPPYGMHVTADFLSIETRKRWVGYLESQHGDPARVHALSDTDPSKLAKEHITGRITDKVNQGELTGEITNAVANAFKGPAAKAFGREIQWFEKPQVLRYEPGGLYGLHADSDHFIPEQGHWRKIIDRDVSLLLYLNEDFEGGGLHLPQFRYIYQPRAGDMLCFPSGGQYAHEALAVKRGIRYVVVSWAAFRDEPRVLELRPSGSIDL